jgi:dethiobiotin synthetase/adenosylmethionine--8-amino-7-oxononanoate aminotransferase
MGLTIVETAGGVLSPGPSGAPQADIFRPMRLPVILVGDHRLGGIASTISAAESLTLRGYDISAVICFDDKGKYENADYLLKYFGKMDIPAFTLPWIPELEGYTQGQERAAMREYYEKQSLAGVMYKLADSIVQRHTERLTTMDKLASRTRKSIWHPFTQHKDLKDTNDILVWDSAYGDYFQAKHTPKSLKGIRAEDAADKPLFYPAFDGSASWWTQGLGHGNPQLALAAAYAAGRYGHVMFAGATHEPAVTLAETLLTGMGNPRLKKCFYTDDGSTAAEVGIKMALRATCKRYNWDGSKDNLEILGLKGSYHGDTIGAMDASEPNVYNEKVDWYRGRGYWFDFPTVKMRGGQWMVESPKDMSKELGGVEFFSHLDDVFDFDARGEGQGRRWWLYEKYIKERLDILVHREGRKFGALVMEPILLGAGGMLFVDPLFQRKLVEIVRAYQFTEEEVKPPADPLHWTGLPVLFDEVFTGLNRLGHFTPSSLLAVHPDISIHAKLLTGGLLPLSVTLASKAIFDAFLSPSKSDALLHGHSYTAHPIGCHVANTSLREMEVLKNGYAWRGFKRKWARESGHKGGQVVKHWTIKGTSEVEEAKKTWSMWGKPLVVWLSYHPTVDHVVAIGSVLAVALKDEEGSGTYLYSHSGFVCSRMLTRAGYTSNAAAGLRDALLNDRSDTAVSVHSRVLGNIIYLMASLTTPPKDIEAVGDVLKQKLDNMAGHTRAPRPMKGSKDVQDITGMKNKD